MLKAMDGIRERDVVKVQELLGYVEKGRAKKSRRRRNGRSTFLLAAMIALALSLAACAVYYGFWMGGLERRFEADEDEKRAAEESGLAMYPGDSETETVSAEKSGVRITVRQTIVDNYGAFVALSIEGFQVPEGASPSILAARISIGGETPETMSGGFAAEQDASGAMEYDISMGSSQPGFFIGKEISIIIEDLGFGDKGRHNTAVEGPWELRWIMKGSSDIRRLELGVEIGDTGVILEKAELSPLSLRLLYTTDGLWEGCETMERFEPMVVGVVLKDGELRLKSFFPDGSGGYIDREKCLLEQRHGNAVIIDPYQVEALLFSYKNPWADQELKESDIIRIPLE